MKSTKSIKLIACLSLFISGCYSSHFTMREVTALNVTKFDSDRIRTVFLCVEVVDPIEKAELVRLLETRFKDKIGSIRQFTSGDMITPNILSTFDLCVKVDMKAAYSGGGFDWRLLTIALYGVGGIVGMMFPPPKFAYSAKYDIELSARYNNRIAKRQFPLELSFQYSVGTADERKNEIWREKWERWTPEERGLAFDYNRNNRPLIDPFISSYLMEQYYPHIADHIIKSVIDVLQTDLLLSTEMN